MKQTLHIFRKDFRHLRLRVLAVLLLVAAHAFYDVHAMPNDPDTDHASSILHSLDAVLPLSIWFLIAWVILEEPLADDRQFWRTRPYHWFSLLAAKVFFVIVFFNLPLFLSDCYILAVQGFPVINVIPKLLLRQLMITSAFVVPSFAISSVSAGVSQFMLGWFLVLVSYVSELILLNTFQNVHVDVTLFGGTVFGFMLAVSLAIVITWQFARRQTLIARTLLLLIVCAPVPAMEFLPLLWPHPAVLTETVQPENQPEFQVVYDLASNRIVNRGQSTDLRIPLLVSGLRPNTLLRGSARVRLVASGRTLPGTGGWYSASVEKIADRYWQIMHLESSEMDQLKSIPVDIHASLDLEIVSDQVQSKIPLTPHTFAVPGVGWCHISNVASFRSLSCRAGLSSATETWVRLDSAAGPVSIVADFMPVEIPWGLSPVTDLASPQVDPRGSSYLAIIPRHKITSFHRTLEAKNVSVPGFIAQ